MCCTIRYVAVDEVGKRRVVTTSSTIPRCNARRTRSLSPSQLTQTGPFPHRPIYALLDLLVLHMDHQATKPNYHLSPPRSWRLSSLVVAVLYFTLSQRNQSQEPLPPPPAKATKVGGGSVLGKVGGVCVIDLLCKKVPFF